MSQARGVSDMAVVAMNEADWIEFDLVDQPVLNGVLGRVELDELPQQNGVEPAFRLRSLPPPLGHRGVFSINHRAISVD